MHKFLTGRILLLLIVSYPLIVQAQVTSYNTGQAFTCISVDSNYNIWAGTNRAGLFFLNKTTNPAQASFTTVSGTPPVDFSRFTIQAIANDKFGNAWIAHNGLGGGSASGGGIDRVNINNTSDSRHYYSDRNAQCFSFFQRDGLGTMNSVSLSIDSAGTLWSAQRYHDLVSAPDYILTPGTLSYKFAGNDFFISKGTYRDYINHADPVELPYPEYTCNAPISVTPQSRTFYSVGAGKKEVWASVASYIPKGGGFLPHRLLRYDVNGNFIASFTLGSIGISGGGIFNGICIASNHDVWVTISGGKGFAVRRKGTWIYMNQQNLSCIFPAGAVSNSNALWANKLGQVFIGTTKGLIVYNGTGPVQQVSSYTLYTTANGALISDNITAGVSERDSVQWIATSAGIMRSTLGRNYPASVVEVDYTSCNDPEINGIEAQSSQDLTGRADYHDYRIETIICNQTGPNGANCNAQNIYKLMKDSVKLTTPLPDDFPYDNLTTALLAGVSKDELGMIVANVNAWNYNPSTGNLHGGIKLIQQVLTPSIYQKYYNPTRGQPPFMFGMENLTRRNFSKLVSPANPVKTLSCSTVYKLYNSMNFIWDRAIYDGLVAFFRFIKVSSCDPLTSAAYDEVLVFADDRNMTITNYTKRGHFLYPGKVVRTVVEECGQVKLITYGTGLSSCGPGLLGQGFGPMNGRGDTIVGSILFKNIDIRLKTAFEKSN